MNATIRSILAAVDRGEGSKSVARKAVQLARLTGARLELFFCDAERAYERQHQYDPRAAASAKESCLADSRRYLESFWRTLAVRDVEASLSVGCESPLYAGIVHAVERDHPDLVVRGVGTQGAEETARIPRYGNYGNGARANGGRAAVTPLEANDWNLVSACPSPLLLTRGKSWKNRPVIAAAIDLSSSESAELTQTILRAAAEFAKRAGGLLEVVHACRLDRPEAEIEGHRAALAERVRSAGIEGAGIHVVVGEPAAALCKFVTQQEVDLIVLGALTHRKTSTALVGTLTRRLMEMLDRDFLLIKPNGLPG